MRIKRTTAIVAGAIGATWMTAVFGLARGFGLTTLDLPLMLATLATGEASGVTWLLGFLLHLAAGGFVALGYAAVFETIGAAGPLRGTLVAVSHTLIAGAILALFPQTRAFPDPLLAPGFMGAAHGWFTPVLFVATHLLYGAIVGGVYRASPVPVQNYARLKPRGLRTAHG